MIHLRLPVLLALFLAGVCECRSDQTLWAIGDADRNNSEFAFAPKNYSQIGGDGFFVIGKSDPKAAWPYAQAGPNDAWGGRRSHAYVIWFGLHQPAAQGTCRLVLRLLDAQHQSPPLLRIAVNGNGFERKTSAGLGDASIFGDPSAGKPSEVLVEFPVTLLRAGNNEISITTVQGSWMMYDSVSLVTPEDVRLAELRDETVLVSAQTEPGWVMRDGKELQRVRLSVLHTGTKTNATFRIGRNPLQSAALKEGFNTVDLLTPAVNRVTKSTCALVANGRDMSSVPLKLVPGVREIIVVFKTHFDIGYTDMATNVVQRYRTSMIDQALDVVDQNRAMPTNQQFAWTLAGWPITRILDDWPGQTEQRKDRVEDALCEGRFVVHALPFSTHTELLETEDLVRGLGYSSRLSRRLELSLPRDGKMTDVPEHTWAMATLLKHAGVDFMMIGCNGASAALQVPWLYWWQGPDGSRVLTMYSPDYGTQLDPPSDWPYRTWLACLHTGDNHGPPRPDEVRNILDRAAKEFPGVKIRIGRLSDFGDAILAEKPELPVVRGDSPDTWIHGPMSDPAGVRIARNTRPLIGASESLNAELRAWGVPVSNNVSTIASAYDQSLLYGEHTWGGAIYWIQNKVAFDSGAFNDDRASGRLARLESSWDEHSAYIRQVRDLVMPSLEKDLQALARNVDAPGWHAVVYNPLPWKRSGLVTVIAPGTSPRAVKPSDGSCISSVLPGKGEITFFARDIPPMGYRTYIAADPGAARANAGKTGATTIESSYFSARLDPQRGIVTSLVDKKSGRELAATIDGRGLGQYLYERFDRDQVMCWFTNYVRPGMVYADFYKPGQPSAQEFPYQALSPSNFKIRFEQTPVSVVAVMEAAAANNLPAVTTRLILYNDQPYADLEMTVHGKPFDPWPEAGWMCLPFNVEKPEFQLGRLGSIIDPAQGLVPGANRHLFGINTGVSITKQGRAGVGFCALDNPLVSFDVPGCWRYSLDFIPRRPIAYVNLFNNQWNTNFRLWNSGTWTSRVRLWSIDRCRAERSIITPSLEARTPLLGAACIGAGPLPRTRRGVEVSQKGVAVTAFGDNPDGPGTILRLWELAGAKGRVKITLRTGTAYRQAQPVDLRGRATGKPLPVRWSAFETDLNGFAPASFVLTAK